MNFDKAIVNLFDDFAKVFGGERRSVSIMKCMKTSTKENNGTPVDTGK